MGGGGLTSVYGEPITEPEDSLPRDLSTVTETADPGGDFVGRAEAPAHKSYGPWWEQLKPHRNAIKKPRHQEEFDELMTICVKSEEPGMGSLRGACVRQLRIFYAKYLHDEQANLESTLSELPESLTA
ncbi:MAG: hypothetical protein WC813_02730 [Patescibacteria group bacterium]|jgi:hypothetical protein